MAALIQTAGAYLARQRWPWWLGVLTWAIVLFLLSANSQPQTGPEFPFKDKVLHCLYFSGGAFCFVLGLLAASNGRVKMVRALAWGLLFAATAGTLDEWHQTFTPGRSGNDPGDWLADSIGGLIGGWLAFLFLQRFRLPSRGRSPINRAEAITSGTHSSKGS
jgi:VanZ family protein